MMQQQDDLDFISLGFGQPKDLDIYNAFASNFDIQHPYTFNGEADLLYHEVNNSYGIFVDEEKIHPMTIAASTHAMHVKSA